MSNAIGMSVIQRIDRLRDRCMELGFEITSCQHSQGWDQIALVPRDDALPIYNRTAQIFAGDLSAVEAFIRGATWARDYDGDHLRISNSQRREAAEQKWRNRILAKTLATGEKVIDPLRELK